MRHPLASRLATLVLVASAILGGVLPVYAALNAPANLSIAPGKYTNDTTPTFTWTSVSGATWYEFFLDDASVWQGIGNVSTYTLSTVQNGWHTFHVRSRDNADGIGGTASLTFEIDTQGPTVPAVTPSTATVNAPVTFSVTPYGESSTRICNLYVYEKNVGAMNKAGTTFSLAHTFTDSRTSADVHATCVDGDNNSTISSTRTVSISQVAALARQIAVKIACGSSASASDTCHAVYYYGLDGKKHLFPSESVYKTWFDSFANVQTVTKNTLASMPLGDNVTYRPGTVLVRFASSYTVYAVDKGSVLRPIVNVAAAESIYGSSWQYSLVTIPETFYNNYSLGGKIYSSANYDRNAVYASVNTIDQCWGDIVHSL